MTMTVQQRPHIRSVLILKADRLCAETLRELTRQVIADAEVTLVHRICDASTVLGAQPIDLLLTGTGCSLGGDVLDFLSTCVASATRPRRIMVVTSHAAQRLFRVLRSMPIQGAFDSAAERPERFADALKTIVNGGSYWSATVMEHVRAPNSVARMLTPCEELVLSILGDGSDIAVAARELGLSLQTISTVRRELHRKLGVQHRGELIRVAAQNGFVRFSPSGVFRPGFAMLSAEYRARRASRTASEIGGTAGCLA